MSKLNFANYEFEKFGYMQPPKPSLNGGLYTGEEFHRDAKYRNFPITPDATQYIHSNLPNDAPFKSRYMYPATRKGNSFVEWKGLTKYEGTSQNNGPYNIYCLPCEPVSKKCDCSDLCPKDQTELCNKNNCINPSEPNMFNKYYYYK